MHIYSKQGQPSERRVSFTALVVIALCSSSCSDGTAGKAPSSNHDRQADVSAPNGSVSSAPQPVSEPFNPTLENLPTQFRAHDIQGILEAAAAHKPKPRSEFESSDDYEKRITDPKAFDIYGRISSGSLLAFSVTPETIEYDVDKQTFRVVLPTSRMLNDGTGLYPFVPVHIEQIRTGQYEASNSFGVTRAVSAIKLRQSGLGIKVVNLIPENGTRHARTVAIPKDQAQEAKANVRFLLVGRTQTPYVTTYRERDEPTLDNPVETLRQFDALLFNPQDIWLYNVATGQVYARGLRPAD